MSPSQPPTTPSIKTTRPKLSYLGWNDALAAYFFNPAQAQQPVFLDVTTQLIEEIGKPLGANLSDFIAATRRGPTWAPDGNVCQRAEKACEKWRERRLGLKYPPYLAYLCLFALAANLEGEFRANAYYPRLRTLLGEGAESGTYPHFHKVLPIWDDLEIWSTEDKDGEWGLFEVRLVGNHIYVGVPFAQSVLSEDERNKLPLVFAEAGLDPRALPADQEILRLLRIYGRGVLRSRTQDLLHRPQNDGELVAAIIAVVRSVLARWDGLLPETEDTGNRSVTNGAPSAQKQYGVLRLTLRLDPLQGRTIIGLRCSLRGEFPEEGLVLSGENVPQLVAVQESNEWSMPLREHQSGKLFDPIQLDWQNGQELTHEHWHFRLSAGKLRIFASGQPEGLPGYVESFRLQVGQTYFIACHATLCEQIESWGNRSCKGGVKRVHITTGLPPQWHLFKTGIVERNTPVEADLSRLAMPTTPRLQLRGGIRLDRGNHYFAFAPPELELESAETDVAVFCGDIQLVRNPQSGRFVLPATLTTGERIEATARAGTADVSRVRFVLEHSSAGSNTYQSEDLIDADPYGVADARWFLTLPFSWPGVTTSEIFLLGQIPGQVIAWPKRHALRGWEPVWAVKLGRHQHVLAVAYCGTNMLPPRLSPNLATSNQSIALWKTFFCHNPQRVRLPASTSAELLWQQYRECALHV